MAQPSPMDVITLLAAKSWMMDQNPDNPNTNSDPNIQLCITAASIEFLRLTGRGSVDPGLDTQNLFNEVVSYNETYDGHGNPRLFLRNAPIASVSSVTMRGVNIPQTTNDAQPGFKIDGSKKSLVLVGAYASIGSFGDAFTWRGVAGGRNRGWSIGTQNIQVQYSAGYPSQEISELDTIPANPGPYTVAVANGPWMSDGGVTYFSNGDPLEAVTIAPQQGQYFIAGPGLYMFNAADAGAQIVIKYAASGCPSDVQQAVCQMVALNVKRRNWVGIRSLAMKDVGSTSYTTWALDPSVTKVVSLYQRTAITG